MHSNNDNTSGHGPEANVPPEVRGWSWGGFFLTWIWGVFNGTFLALLCLIPFVNLVMPFVLGFKGNEWAWRNKRWQSIQHFHAVQRKWAIASAIVFAVSIVSAIGFGIMGAIMSTAITKQVNTMLMRSDAYQKPMNMAIDNAAVTAALGEDIESDGNVKGNYNLSDSSGEVDIAIPVKGSNGKGTIYVKGTKEAGLWSFTLVKFGKEGSDERIDLLPGGSKSSAPASKEAEDAKNEAKDND